MKKLTEKEKKERKYLMVLPLLTLPFLCLAFWALGGGKASSPTKAPSEQGLNLRLPEVSPESEQLDKMQSYERAEEKARLQREPDFMEQDWEFQPNPDSHKMATEERMFTDFGLEETELALMKKLEEIQFLAKEPEEPTELDISEPLPELGGGRPESFEPDLRRLESKMVPAAGEMDPEMEKIDAMLDKMLDLQHPERVEERLARNPEKREVEPMAVRLDPFDPDVDSGWGVSEEAAERNGFYSLEDNKRVSLSGIRPAIEARVTVDQEIVTGASVELELAQPVYVRGMEFSEGTPVSGRCTLNGERLEIHVETIRLGNLIVPVRLSAVGQDGLPGIKIPGAIARDAAKQGIGDGVRSLNPMAMSDSWEAQATMTGMETVKGLVSKKSRLVRVTVKAGHPLLLKDLSDF
ncbi:conjugative transposon protein TraM [Algoriphagus terrigena]|uniref:conjugative transposon protein TraM n=1 Tax=Algoriphagus terrigena TaxID=344884 RepID=UPI0003F93F8E|nr:conjugative transposon protein TraM [Algoriphagus terrigena]